LPSGVVIKMLNNLSNRSLSQWISGDGPEGDIVLSSRIRLARNLEKYPFPNRASKEERKAVIAEVREAISGIEDYRLHYIEMADLPELERELLVEKHLVSPVHATDDPEKGVFIDDNEKISIMVNEEDHIRLQVLTAGLQLKEAWGIASELDDILEDKLDIAFSKRWGFLTACPTNLGTGLRASVMVHLPALNLTNNIGKMLTAVSQLGLAVRGLYGEGSESIGNLYQISNQVTLGHSEKDIMENLVTVTQQVINQERKAREALQQDVKVIDNVKRSYGILKYAYQLSSDEAIRLLSNVKLGIDMGIIDYVEDKVLRELMILIRPAHIQKMYGKELVTIERDIKRAELVQALLKS